MKALCWEGTGDVRVERVPDPQILNSRDVIIKVTSTAICGSDLHIYDGYIKAMKKGDVLGHEFMGEVVEVGAKVDGFKVGDRVVSPFAIACGECYYCKNDLWALCDNTNPNANLLDKVYGFGGAGLFGYSHMYGGFAGGQAEYVRVPFADVGLLKLNGHLRDEQALFLSDTLPTGYQAAEYCNIKRGDVIAVWGCGPVGQMAIQCAWLLGAERVIAFDRVPVRLEMARVHGKAEVYNYTDIDVVEVLKQLTGGRGPDACIDCVGLEAHGPLKAELVDRVKDAARLHLEHPHALYQAIQACGKGGTVSISGVYATFLNGFPMGAAFAKGLTLKMGQTHVHKYMRKLLDHIERGELDPSFVVTHRMSLDEAPNGYKTFRDKQDSCIKVVLKPS